MVGASYLIHQHEVKNTVSLFFFMYTFTFTRFVPSFVYGGLYFRTPLS